MKYREYINHLQQFSQFMEKRIDGFSINEIFNPESKPFIKDWADDDNIPVPVRGDGMGNKSGLYFLIGEDGSVLYIGKATKNNIHERVWDHIRTPMDGCKTNAKIFPHNRFKTEGESKYSILVESGDIKLGLVEIIPSNGITVAEVYLQTIFLPPLCKQIG